MVIQIKDIEKLPVDFEEIMEVLKQRVQTKLPNRWTDFLQSNFGVELLEAVAYEAMLMNYYVNANINESFMPTAKTEHAVKNLARTIGYKPSRASQSLVPVTFQLEKTSSNTIYIPKYTKISTDNNIKFYTTEEVIISPHETMTTTNAKSGILSTDIIISNGIAKYRYKLRKQNVVHIESVISDNFEYEYVDFIDTNAKNPYYTVEYDSDNNAYIIFGDNIYGINPYEGETITVLYVIDNDSLENNNILPNAITTIDSLIYDVTGALVTDIKAYNEIIATGGSTAETLDEIKRNAPSIYRTQHRAVTRQDFKDLVLAMPEIEKVSIIDHYNLEEVGIFGVKICPIPKNGGYLNRLLKEKILNYLEDKKIISTQISIIDPTYITFDMNILLQASPTANLNILKNSIKKEISSYLAWQNREFGQEVDKTEIQRRVSSLVDVLQVYNIDLFENRRIYITNVYFETDEVVTNKIKFNDSIHILKEGSKIAIANPEGQIQLHTMITSFNDDGTITITDNITKEMRIVSGCNVYPLQKVTEDYRFGDKEIGLRHEHIYDEHQNFLEFIEDYEQILTNLMHCTIFFQNSPEEIYTILYRIGEKVYLNRPLSSNVSSGEYVYIINKYNTPTLSATTLSGSNRFKFKDYPRFGRNTTLKFYDFEQSEELLLQLIKSNSEFDFLDNYYDTQGLIAINKIYISDSNQFVENEDYLLENNMKVIHWTPEGRRKIATGTKFYISTVRKNVLHTDQVFTVTKIDGKYVSFLPVSTKTLNENSTFSFSTDTYNLLPFEIADVGNININIV